MIAIIQETLRPFGITGGRHGFPRIVRAIELVLEDETRLYAVTKEVYKATGSDLKCSWVTVERNIRSAIDTAWERDRALLVEMAGYSLSQPPPSSEFLEIISNYIQRSEMEKRKSEDFGSTGRG